MTYSHYLWLDHSKKGKTMTVIDTKLYRRVEVINDEHNGTIIEITCTVSGERQAARFNAGELAQLREALKAPSSAEFYDADGEKWELVDGRLHLADHRSTCRRPGWPWDEINGAYGPLVPVQSVDTKYVVALDQGYLAVPGVADGLEDAAMFDTEEQARSFLIERERQVTDLGGEIAEAQITKVCGTYMGRWIA